MGKLLSKFKREALATQSNDDAFLTFAGLETMTKENYDESPFHNNSVLVINPYKTSAGDWVFDEPRVGLVQEALVLGIDRMIEVLTAEKGIRNAEEGFKCIFSSRPLPGSYVLQLVGPPEGMDPKMGGNWYRLSSHDMTGWLCPALYHFFREAPESIYVVMEQRR